MELDKIVKNWKVTMPVATIVFTGTLWVVGAEFPKPVFASEYRKDIVQLNVTQLNTREEFLSDKLERLRKEELELEQKTWDIQTEGKPIPEFLPALTHKVKSQIVDLESTLKETHYQRLKLQEQ